MKPGERWALRGYQIRSDNGRGQHVATYMTDEVDGRVLAAAPALLEALEAFVAWHDGPGAAGVSYITPPVTVARAAIADARSVARLERPRPT